MQILRNKDVHYLQGTGMLGQDRYCIDFYIYVVDGLAVDTGPIMCADQSSIFYDRHHAEQVFLSHAHEDHTGMARWLQVNKKAVIYIHPMAVKSTELPQPLPQYRKIFWGERPPFSARPMPKKIFTDHYCFNCLSAPGHCPDHMILYEENRGWIFSGDLLVNTRPFLGFFEDDFCQVIDSLNMVLNIDFEVLFCAHTGPQTRPHEKLLQKRDYLLELQHKVNTLRRQGLTDPEIDSRLFPVQPSVTRLSGGEWASWHLIKSI